MSDESYLADGVESPQAFPNEVARWDAELRASETVMKRWRKDAEEISKRYALELKNVLKEESAPEFNILWSNIQTLLPAVYGQEPVPVVKRRFRDRDVTARLASEVLERAVISEMEADERMGMSLDDVMLRATLDLLLEARGVGWVRYDAEIEGDTVLSESCPVEYLSRDEFLHAPRRTWAEVQKRGWVARRVDMTRAEGLKRFGDNFRHVPLKTVGAGHDEKDDTDRDRMEVIGRAAVWEIWDAPSRTVTWISRDWQDAVLDKRPDPLKLEGFFPCPKPAYGGFGNASLIPIPDYNQYSKLAKELDTQTERISALTEDLLVRGIYDSSMPNLGNLLDSGQSKMVAVDNMRSYVESGGNINNAVQYLPLQPIAEALVGLYEGRARTKETLYEVSGIADVLRGVVDPREKLGQSNIKEQNAGRRIDSRRRSVEHLGRGLLRRKAELIAEHYSPENIRQISGFDMLPEIMELQDEAEAAFAEVEEINAQLMELMRQPPPPPPAPPMPPEGAPPGEPPPEPPPDPMAQQQEMQFAIEDAQSRALEAENRIEELWRGTIELIRSERLRGFRLEVETNSTILPNDDQEKERRTEFMDIAGSFIERVMPMVQMFPDLMAPLGQMFLFTLRAFRTGRTLESSWEDFVERAVQMMNAPPSEEEGPDPAAEAAAAQADATAAQADAAMQKAQTDADIAAYQAEIKTQAQQLDMHVKMQEAQMKLATLRAQTEADVTKAQTEQQQSVHDLEMTIAEHQADLARLREEAKIQRETRLVDLATKTAEAQTRQEAKPLAH